MKLSSRDDEHFSLLKKLDEFARKNGYSISDIEAESGLLKSIKNSLKEHKNHDARIHGFHVESMFAYVASALGECEILIEEDSGQFISHSEEMIRPDFRIKTFNHGEMFVEVKSFRSSPFKEYTIKGKYLKSLKHYAKTFNVPLKLAIYWSRWNIWTLIDASQLDETMTKIKISLGDACLNNEMYLLGDSMLGIEPPLSFRFYANKNKPSKIEPDGSVKFEIQKVCMNVAGKDIEEKLELNLAWYLMNYGNWTGCTDTAKIPNGCLDYTELKIFPEELDDAQDDSQFKNIGFQSGMISKKYSQLTCSNNKVINLTPREQPDTLGFQIPNDYKGKVLKLWRFTMYPKDYEFNQSLLK